jgi:hypothetical protein
VNAEHRGIMLSLGDRNRLVGAGKYLERKGFKQEAEVIRGVVERFDAASDFTVIHRSAIGPPKPEAQAA